MDAEVTYSEIKTCSQCGKDVREMLVNGDFSCVVNGYPVAATGLYLVHPCDRERYYGSLGQQKQGRLTI